MKRQAYAKKRDANELEIVKALEKVGATVKRLDDLDLLVGYRGKTHLMECKTLTGKLTDPQKDFIKEWKGSPLHIVRTPEAAIDIITRQL